MSSFFEDPYLMVAAAGFIFAIGGQLASNRWVHRCTERRLKRIERHLGIEEQ